MEAPHSPSPFGTDTQPYWNRRQTLFSKFDDGVLIDREGLFSVKPEAVALRIAHRMRGDTVLDAFCGVGGSAIAFARAGKRVITIDKNRERLDFAAHNAKLYGVFDKIKFIHADAESYLKNPEQQFDSVYLDPPWGGSDYRKHKYFLFEMFSPNGLHLIDLSLRSIKNVALTLPKNFDLRELMKIQPDFYFEKNFMNRTLLFCTIYLEGSHDAKDKLS